jgi:hypothetical protein
VNLKGLSLNMQVTSKKWPFNLGKECLYAKVLCLCCCIHILSIHMYILSIHTYVYFVYTYVCAPCSKKNTGNGIADSRMQKKLSIFSGRCLKWRGIILDEENEKCMTFPIVPARSSGIH